MYENEFDKGLIKNGWEHNTRELWFKGRLEIEETEWQSIYTIRINDDLKDQVINGYLNELNKIVKTKVKRKELVVLVMEL